MDGVVVLLKPPGMTSSNAVYDTRKLLSERRAGHLGTLDPAAAGVLPICLGRATRLFDLLVDKDKEYIFELAFGARTDTQDAYGRVLAWDGRLISREALAAALPDFLGEQRQTASVYSALKVGGRKMCDLARAGEVVEPREREVRVTALELLEQTGERRFLLRVECSRGTYVRALCESIAERLGTIAYVSFLLRTRAGPFTIEHALSVDELRETLGRGTIAERIVSCEEAIAFLPALRLPNERRTASVNALETRVGGAAEGAVRLYAGEEFLGVGRVENGAVKLAIHLY